MYPVLEFRFTELVPTKMYNVFVEIIPVDNYCWKFKNGKWKPFDDIERKTRAGGIYLHPDSPSNGAFWMKENVVFNKLKLTNIARDVSGQIYLNSMHKYQPRVHVIEVGQNRAGDPDTLQTKVFQETQFIAVTGYQNVEITQLKIDNNPFATGFRDSKHGRMYPVLEFRFTELVPTKMYNVFVEIIPVDNYCWKFKNGKWKPFDDIERKTRAGGIYLHPDSPSNGAFWMKENVVFNKLKLTNIARDVSGQIYLNSMHKYQPRVHVIEVGQNRAGGPDTLQTKVFQETQFMAVTSYQNVEITQLKIDNNPFATGFRDSKHGNVTSNRNMPGCQHNETLFLEDNVLFPSIYSSDDSFVSGEHMIKSENERTINECHDPTNGYSVSNPTYSPYYQSSSYSTAGVISSTNQHGDLQVAMTFNQLRTDQEGQFLMNMSDVMRKRPDDQMYGVEPTTKTNQVFWYDV
ncbi:T-box transcription factor TBX5-like [Ruditapes philippinarum]|uniref:T-box transcription factor TBX5-like n=1 Tax=Ruditapes philippinarum TaxID=129788 RepID=UPI00295B3337|nr:T-box transcription factor TBX5-like [Ruditapes philippinarum]